MLLRDCQMLLFSATFEDSVWKFAQKVVPDPNIIKLKREEETLDTIKQYYVLCNSREEKFQALCNIYGAITIAQAMIFCHVSGWKEENQCLGKGKTGALCSTLNSCETVCLRRRFPHLFLRVLISLLIALCRLARRLAGWQGSSRRKVTKWLS